jgi:hypothetical protein
VGRLIVRDYDQGHSFEMARPIPNNEIRDVVAHLKPKLAPWRRYEPKSASHNEGDADMNRNLRHIMKVAQI